MKKFTINYFILLGIIILSVCTQLSYANYNKEFQVNNYTDENQTNPTICDLSEDRFIICWESVNQDGSSYGIFGKIFDNNGNAIVEEFRVNDYTTSEQRRPKIMKLDETKFVICWDSNWQDNSKEGVFFKIFNHLGESLTDEIQANTYTIGSQMYQTLLNLKNDRFVITWLSHDQDGSQNGIYSQIFDYQGNKIGSEFRVNMTTYRNQDSPKLLSLENGNFMVIWRSDDANAYHDEIYGRIFNYNGASLGDEFKINTFKYAEYSSINVELINSNKIIICWDSNHPHWHPGDQHDDQDGSEGGVFAQIIDSTGNKIGEEFQVNTSVDGDQKNLGIISKNDMVAVLWRDRGDCGLYYQKYDLLGEKIGDETLLAYAYSLPYSSHQPHVRINDFGEYGFILYWHVHTNEMYGEDIIAQRFDNDFSSIGQIFIVNSFRNRYQLNPRLAVLNNELFSITWFSDAHDGSKEGVFAKIMYQMPIKHKLIDYTTLYPMNDQSLTTAKPTFSWRFPCNQHLNFQWEIEYNLYISEDEEFTDPLIIEGITDTTYQIDTLAAGKTYFWKVLAKNYDGDSLWSSNVNGFFIDYGATDVEADDPSTDGLPTEFVLEQNYPNPFNPATTINYSIPAVVGTGHAPSLQTELIIYDVLGNKIKTLVNEQKSAGSYSVQFNASELTSGVYFYRLQAGQYSETKKMVLIK